MSPQYLVVLVSELRTIWQDVHTSHVREFFAPTLQIRPVLRLHGVLNGTRYRIIDAENRSLHELDLPSGIAP